MEKEPPDWTILENRTVEKDETDLSLRELIKAFCELVYITLYGFDTKNK